MAQSGFLPSLREKVDEGGSVDRMLERSAGLDQHLINSMVVAEDGRVSIIPDETRVANVTRKTAFGLYCHRYTPLVIPPLTNFLALTPVHDLDNMNFILVMAHNERFRPRPWTHVQTLNRPGSGRVEVIDYMFVRNWVWADFGRLFCIMCFQETVWAAVRCPNPPSRRNPKRRVGPAYSGQGQLAFG